MGYRQSDLVVRNSIEEISKKMLRSMYASAEGDNVICSPFSLVMALTILLNAVVKDGRCEIENIISDSLPSQEITKALAKLQKQLGAHRDDCKFVSSNGICIKEDFVGSILEDFKNIVMNELEGELFSAGSDMRERINEWVSKKTDGLIPKMMEENIPELKVALINAVSFAAKWETDYGWDDIDEDMEFTNYDKSVSKVTMLYSCESEYVSNPSYTGVVKNYKGGEYAFMALLPKRKTRKAFGKALADADFAELYNNRKVIDVYTEIPEFEITGDMELTGFCKELGINIVFTEQADFSGMTKRGPLMVDSILQKEFIKVNRAGTVAAAATEVMVVDGCAVDFEESKTVYLDRPFVYAIMNRETGLPVFSGVVNHL